MAAASPNTLTEYPKSMTTVLNHTDGDRVLAYPPSSSPGTFLDAQGIGVNVLPITATAL